MRLKAFAAFLLIYTIQETFGDRDLYDELNTSKLSHPNLKLVGDSGKSRYKKPTNYLQKKFRNLEKEKKEQYEKKKILKQKTDEKPVKALLEKDYEFHGQGFLKDERWQLCQSLTEDSVKDTLLKFGVVTNIIPDVQKFRTSIKSLKDSLPVTKKKINKKKEKMERELGGHVKLSQSNYLGRAMGVLVPPQSEEIGIYDAGNMLDSGEALSREKRSIHKSKNRKYGRKGKGSWLETMMKDSKRKGTSRNFDQVPQCYGWRYLSAIFALTSDNTADIDVLTGSVSDMLNVQFAETVADILQTCGQRLDNTNGLCPPAEETKLKEVCISECEQDNECGYQELCCRQGCSNSCVSVRGSKLDKCASADQYMQCVYNMIDTQLCDTDR